MKGADRDAGLGGPGPVVAQLGQHAVVQPVGVRARQAVVEDGDLRAARLGGDERRAGDARLERVAEEREGQRRDPLADQRAAALPGEDGAAVLGVLTAQRVEGQGSHHVADGGGRHDHLVAAGLQGDLRRGPVEPAPNLLLHLLERGRDRGLGDPGRAAPVRRAPDQADGTRRLRVGQPHTGRAAEIQRGHILFGESRQDGVAGTRRPNAPDRADSTSSSAPASVDSGSSPKSRAGRVSDGSTRGKASVAGAASPRQPERRPPSPPLRPGRPRRRAGPSRPTRRPAR